VPLRAVQFIGILARPEGCERARTTIVIEGIEEPVDALRAA
jgi:hypothetical protein